MEKVIKSSKEYKKCFKNIYPMLYVSQVPCGFPSPAEDYIETPLDLNDHLISKPAATFFVKAKGDSMIGVGIFDGDLLIIDRSKTANNDQVILAVLNGEFTLKKLVKIRNELWLYPENSKYKPIRINEEMDFQVWGVLTYSIHKHQGSHVRSN